MYKVEKIIGKRQSIKKKGKVQYLVKWEGWDIKDSTWQPKRHLQYVQSLIEEFQIANYQTIVIQDDSEFISSIIYIETQPNQQDHAGVSCLTNQLPFIAIRIPKQKNQETKVQYQKQKIIDQTNKFISSPFQYLSFVKPLKKGKINQKQDCKINQTTQKSKNSVTATQSTVQVSLSQYKQSDEKMNIHIAGMKKEGKDFWYFIVEENNQKWVKRDYVIKKYPVLLCQFYEQRLIFNTN